MRLLIDTNIYVAAKKGNLEVLDRLATADEVNIPYVVLAELRAGFLGGTKTTANEEELRLFLKSPSVLIRFADQETTQLYAELWNELKKSGKPIPQNDVWIAAICLQYGLRLYTLDAHFDRLPKLQRVT